jgi:glycosyltransferase involved in cell wall biosynthesis
MKSEGSNIVSIIIPIYNVEKYIQQCLESVTYQTYGNLEILCVDDCGQDDSIAIVEAYALKDARITLITHSLNQGLACARNTGMEYATGEYLYFLDSDDFISCDAIQSMLDSALNHRSDVVFSRVELAVEEDAKGDELSAIKRYLSFEAQSEYEDVSRDTFELFLEKFPCVAWNKLFNAEFLKSNYISFVKQNIVHEDEGFHVKILANLPRISFVDEVGYFYRIRSNSIMQKAINDWEKKVKALTVSLDDAISYLNKYEKSEYIELVKARPLYRHCYAAENKKKPSLFSKLIRIRVRRNHKRLQIFGITLYESKR